MLNRVSALAAPEPDELVGRWSIDRDLEDVRAGRRGHFTGMLSVEPATHGYRWLNYGSFTWGDYQGSAERQLGLSVRDGEWWMTFADGRAFHPWRYNARLVHPCADDLYRGSVSYDPSSSDRMRICWEVTGPRKHQRIISRLRRYGQRVNPGGAS